VCSRNLKNEEAMTRLGSQRQREKKKVELNNMNINIGANNGSEKNRLYLLIVVKTPSLASSALSVRKHSPLQF
jgi:hypothetical protein